MHRTLRLASTLQIVVPALLVAQAPRPVQVGIGGGATVPIGTFADDVKSGFHGAAFVQYEPAANIWGVRGEVLYTRSELTEEARGDVGAGPDDELNTGVLAVQASAILMGRRRDRGITPYLIGGLGLYRLTVTRSGDVDLSDSENGFGFSGGAGVRFGRTSGVFAEIRFHSFTLTPEGAESTSYQMIPVTVGVRF
ncbi:MAG: outer membrane beta-barrel protein [Gemmatimonadota bacterium]